jgi:hypothetical protein
MALDLLEKEPSRPGAHVGRNADGSTDARIVLCSDIGKAPYLTLSYCWGGD